MITNHVGFYYSGTTAERAALSPQTSSGFYDTDLAVWCIWNGSYWRQTDVGLHWLIGGGVISDEGGLNVQWSAGSVHCGTCNGIEQFDARGTDFALTDDTINYLYHTHGNATIQKKATLPDYSAGETAIAHAHCANGDIWGIHQEESAGHALTTVMLGVAEVLPAIITNGLVISEDGAGDPLDVSQSAGHYHMAMHEAITVAQIDSRTTAMRRWYKDGAGTDYTNDTNAEIDTAQYDNAGTLTAIPNNQWVRTVFFTDGTYIHWVYATATYANITLALNAPDPDVPTGLAGMLPKTTALIYQEGDAGLPAAGSDQWIDVRPMIGASSSNAPVTDHGNLSGLAGDDHTIYLLADGTRALAGAWDMGSQVITNANIDTGDIASAVTHAEWDAAVAHISADGSSHGHIDQAVTVASTPTLAGLTLVNAITEFSTDDTLGGDSDSAVPTEQAVKAYVDAVGGGIEVQEDDVKVLDATIINFEGGTGKVTDEGGGKATVDITGGGGAVTESAIALMSTTAGINAKTVAATTLYTVPGGKTFIPDHVVIRVTAFTVGAKAVQAVASFGGNGATYDDYLNSVPYTVAAADVFIKDEARGTVEVAGWEELDRGSGAAASYDFQNISQDYIDLKIEFRLRTDNAGVTDTADISLNNDAVAANYRLQQLYGLDAATGAASADGINFVDANGATAPAGYFAAGHVICQRYAEAELHYLFSTSAMRWAAANTIYRARTLHWETANAITRATLTPTGGANFVAGSEAILYGLRKRDVVSGVIAKTVQAAADVFKIAIETGSDATTETWAVDLFGYLV